MIEIIKRTGVFLIMAETLYQFVQENSYARYVRLLIRLMTLALLLLPLLDLVKAGSSDFFWQRVNELEAAYAEYEAENMDEEYSRKAQEALSEEHYNEAVGEYTSTHIKSICNKCALENGYIIEEVVIAESGILFRLQVPVMQAEEGEHANAEIQIEPIERVEEIQIAGNNTDEDGQIEETDWGQEELRMQILLSEFLGIAKQMIEVEIDG